MYDFAVAIFTRQIFTQQADDGGIVSSASLLRLACEFTY